ncbi:c-type cytochrome [Novosphingobium sp. KACC 22771]|uniref:c-type cytochrome n=1 Tax=Novosphingobium sp. KACC 22771 TaxID=3025670 RepID=UPI002365E45D|nr:c-type cytochrome [Novosphingobium sp. KACC 22771]WDF70899.1 c-type cytochrome [Novosphingobium sp. KACC 22771]
MMKREIFAGMMIAAVAMLPVAIRADAAKPAHSGNIAHGMRLYQACMGCHSLDENDVGPRHRGVVGRQAGALPAYAYSAALRSSHLRWTPANLDRWLAGPQALVPGAKMYYTVPDSQDRADIIAYLASQK